MSITMILAVIGVALGAGGYYFANPALSGWGFAAAVAALIAWLARNAWEQRAAQQGDAGSASSPDLGGPGDGEGGSDA